MLTIGVPCIILVACLSAPCGVSCVQKLRSTSVRSSIDTIRLYSSVPARVLPVSVKKIGLV